MDKSYFAVLAIGRDTHGIVAAITGALSERHACNVETSQMMALGGHFALALIASSEDPVDLSQIKVGLAASGSEESMLQVDVSPIKADDFRLVGRVEPSHRIFAVASDQAGLVHGMAQTLAEREVDIGYLASQRHEIAPEPLCQIAMDVALPSDMNEEELHERLNKVLPKESELIIEPAPQHDSGN